MSSEAALAPTLSPAAVGTVDLGPLCPADFRVSEGDVRVCEAVTDFAAPPLVRELFQKTYPKDMF